MYVPMRLTIIKLINTDFVLKSYNHEPCETENGLYLTTDL